MSLRWARAALAGVLLASSGAAAVDAAPLASVPAFETLDGATMALPTGPEQQLVVFWATWCKECKEKLTTTLPAIDQRPDVAVVTVNVDPEAKRAQHFVTANAVKLPVYREPAKAMQKELKIFGVPHWALLRWSAGAAGGPGAWTVIDQAAGYDEGRIHAALGKG